MQGCEVEWVAGFTTGEGTFFISINKDRNRVGVGFSLLFSIAQHIRDEMLIRSFVDFFSCGQFLNQKRDLPQKGGGMIRQPKAAAGSTYLGLLSLY